MRIALLTHEPFHPPSGGGSTEAPYLVRELVRRGHEVTVYGPQIPEQADVEQRFNIRIIPFTLWKMGRYTPLRNLKYLLYPFLLERLATRTQAQFPCELILSMHSISAVAAGRLRQKLQVPVVMNFLDYLTAFMETWPPFLAPPRLLKRLMDFELGLPSRYQANGILTVSAPLAKRFADAGYPRSQIQDIGFGYDSEHFEFQPEFHHPSESGPRVIAMHGSFDNHHLGPILRGAMEFLATRRPGITFRFIGRQTPALTRFMKSVATLRPAIQTECTGFTPYEQVPARLREAHLGIIPYEESRGVHCAFIAKAVEFLGMGIPVVSTPAQAIREYFEHDPLIRFSEFKGESFGRTILERLEDPAPQLAAHREQTARRIKNHLDWRVISRKAADFVEATQRGQT